MTQTERFSTDGCPSASKVEYWNRLANETFIDLTVDPADRASFRGELSRADLGAIGLAVARSAPATVRRIPSRAERAAPESVFFVHLQGRGHSICEQDGRQALLGPGDFAICDTARPYSLIFAEANEMFVAKIPGPLLRQRLPDPEHKVAVRMRGSEIRPGLVSTFLRGACRQLEGAKDTGWCQAVSNTLLDLMELAYGEQDGASGVRARLRRRACALIDAELCDSSLTPHGVAGSLGVSPRYLQMAFADVGETPSDYIRERRLDLARRLLTSDGGPQTITDLALEVGFGDLTYFSRAFRGRFGVSPRAYRAERARPH